MEFQRPVVFDAVSEFQDSVVFDTDVTITGSAIINNPDFESMSIVNGAADDGGADALPQYPYGYMVVTINDSEFLIAIYDPVLDTNGNHVNVKPVRIQKEATKVNVSNKKVTPSKQVITKA
jgi:hypothetical protein